MSTTTNDLISHMVHIGRPTFKWNPKMKKYIAGQSKHVHILDVYQVQDLLSDALEYLARSHREGKSFLLVGTKFQVSDLIEVMGSQLHIPYVHHKWLAGLLTNFETVKKRIDRLRSIEDMQRSGEIEKYTKKERLRLEKERSNLQLELGGVRDMETLPDVLILVDANKEHIALAEATILGIAVVAILNTNANPDGVMYPIPANDTSRRSLQYLLEQITKVFSAQRTAVSDEAGSIEAPTEA